MNGNSHSLRPTVYFCYAKPEGFSGQKEATEMLRRGLAGRGWDCRALPQPVLDREAGMGAAMFLRFAFGLMAAWLRALRLLVAADASLCVNLGQTGMAFVRDAVPLLLGRWSLGRERVLLSLHGSLFMSWPEGSAKARVFVFLLRQGRMVTVLGEKQRQRLVALGLPASQVAVVVNSCALPALSPDELAKKWPVPPGRRRPLRLLHLSSLIASKGFPEYLEAAAALALREGPPLEFVLCGKPVASEFQDRFRNVDVAEEWIMGMMARINRSTRVRVRWVRGAVGAEKTRLFHEADIFVLPTRYAVEAQPLVLLEAMASGCAILTTRAGEIPTILDDGSARFLEAGAADEVAGALEEWAASPEAPARLAGAAHRRFVHQYELEHHLDGWEERLSPPRHPAGLPAMAEGRANR